MGRNGGGIQWNFAEGTLQLLINLHFTGGRAFKVNYTLADGTNGTVNISKISKGTYCNWDVLEHAGLVEKCTDIRTLSLLNNNSGGEVRIYDMYIRVPDTNGTPSCIHMVDSDAADKTVKIIRDGRLVIQRNGVLYNVQGQLLLNE